METLYQGIRHRLSKDLPGFSAHEKMLVPGRKARSAKIKPNPRISAVLLMLYEDNDILHFPLILRPKYDGVHGGQMALPGGGIEAQDTDLEATALRESFEEIGYTVPKTQVLGQLTPFYIPPSNSMVTPYVAYTTEKPRYNIDPKEVDRVVIADIHTLQNPDNHTTKLIDLPNGQQLHAPAYLVDGEIVWGATAMILAEFLHVFDDVYVN
ncbi:MAG: NUDIX hydrolase [Flammeovirgaceae bacterium]